MAEAKSAERAKLTRAVSATAIRNQQAQASETSARSEAAFVWPGAPMAETRVGRLRPNAVVRGAEARGGA
eukprot:1269503-Lingulodinium_polyedra.AAC.1